MSWKSARLGDAKPGLSPRHFLDWLLWRMPVIPAVWEMDAGE